MSYLRSFRPWIAYGIASAVIDWRAAAAIAFLVATREVHRQTAEHGDVDDLTVTTRWFFLGLTVLSLARPDTPLHHYTPALSLLALGTAAAWSLLEGDPFTSTIAKRTSPVEFWELPLFRRANTTITVVWAASFLVTAAACATILALAPSATAAWVGAEALGFAIPVIFTAAYRQHLRDRVLQGVSTA